jgi:VanZ family protein
VIRWLIWSTFAVLWTVVLLLPGKEFVKTGVPDWAPSLWFFVTKGGHILAYTLFTFLSGWVLVPARYRWIMLFIVLAHGSITELLQLHFVEGRLGCLEDVGLNHAGVLLGVMVGWKWWTDPK